MLPLGAAVAIRGQAPWIGDAELRRRFAADAWRPIGGIFKKSARGMVLSGLAPTPEFCAILLRAIGAGITDSDSFLFLSIPAIACCDRFGASPDRT
jgi:hypothetical protein